MKHQKHWIRSTAQVMALVASSTLTFAVLAAGGDHDHGAAQGGTSTNDPMSGMMHGMASHMKHISEMMMKGPLDPDMHKKMAANMQTMSTMMDRMSGMMGKDMKMNPDMQKQMEDMHKQMDEMMKQSMASGKK